MSHLLLHPKTPTTRRQRQLPPPATPTPTPAPYVTTPNPTPTLHTPHKGRMETRTTSRVEIMREIGYRAHTPIRTHFCQQQVGPHRCS